MHPGCILLTRTAPAMPASPRFFVDMDTPGSRSGRCAMHDVDELPKSISTTSSLPAGRMLGQPGDGWKLAMDLLPYERSTCFWHRIAYLLATLDDLAGRIRRGRRSRSRSGFILDGAHRAPRSYTSPSAFLAETGCVGPGNLHRQGVVVDG